MGCCCSCFKDGESSGNNGTFSSETEMKSMGGSSDDANNNNGGNGMYISRKMSARSIVLESQLTASGNGLALAGVPIEQDAAYWEWHIELPAADGGSTSAEILVGVATKKDRKFYDLLDEKDEDNRQPKGTDMMRKIAVSNEDVLGVAVQQSDLPMVQFLLNGKPLHELAVNRFRGTVYPSIYLPPPPPESATENKSGLKVTLVLNEKDFKQLSPHARFGPVIVARGLI